MTNLCAFSDLTAQAKQAENWTKVRRGLGLLGLIALGLSASACGFQPLYGQANNMALLRKVGIETPEDRTGFMVRQAFYDQIGGTPGENPRYSLKVKIVEKHYGIGFSATDNANRYEINEAITWTLVERDTGKTLKTSSRNVVITYPASVPAYAGVSAHQDGQTRAAEQIAQSLVTDLSLYFSKPTE